MKDLAGKVAVVTGAAGGIGRGVALALADAGTNVVIADLNEAGAKAVAAEVAEKGVRSLAQGTDVTDGASVDALAAAAYAEFGAVHVLHNNAGVAAFARLDATTDADWRWMTSINIDGVVNGLQAFLPRMKAQDGEKHIVNTASLAGMVAGPGLGAYNATKFAVVAISETLRYELADEGFGVSVLCPGGVSTSIMENSRRQQPSGGTDAMLPTGGGDPGRMRMATPEEVGVLVRQGIVDNDLYIFTHPELKPIVRARFDRILAAFEKAAAAQEGGV